MLNYCFICSPHIILPICVSPKGRVLKAAFLPCGGCMLIASLTAYRNTRALVSV